jgi:ribosomal protein L29
MKDITKGKTVKELQGLLKDKRDALREFSQNVFQGKTKNVKEGRSIRKDIARILTTINMEEKIQKK